VSGYILFRKEDPDVEFALSQSEMNDLVDSLKRHAEDQGIRLLLDRIVEWRAVRFQCDDDRCEENAVFEVIVEEGEGWWCEKHMKEICASTEEQEDRGYVDEHGSVYITKDSFRRIRLCKNCESQQPALGGNRESCDVCGHNCEPESGER
jgi:hypothetical protein